jgi:AcrR family transcriptional regulator
MPPRTRRDEVLELAGELFARNGYATTTVRDIAGAAGILSGSLYHHFASKEAIVDALLQPFLDQLLDRCDEIAASDLAPEAAFEALATASFDALDEHATAIAIYEDDGRRLEAQPHFAYLRAAGEHLAAVWTQEIERGVASGAFRADLDPSLTYAYVRATLWDVARRVSGGADGRGTAAVADRQLELLLRGIRADTPADPVVEPEQAAERERSKKKGKKKKG